MLSSDTPAVPPRESITPAAGSDRAIPAQDRRISGLERFNTVTPGAAEAALLACCCSRRWARRLADHRPYPDLDALLAAADEASYDLTTADLAEALADESAAGGMPGISASPLPGRGHSAAHTALRAAHAAYESRFGHVFVICLDGLGPDELLDHVLAGIRARLSNELDEERAVTAEELRRIARGRLIHLVANRPESDSLDPPDSPYVPL
ncbi:2-oxo-4-hydroxy-4-carboxy-5-ureidoimidazoline decarboxylase [Streptomyces sp. 8N706]|uniref:2-oxo-4-hydroxy-4-carboxy-5-ureidoimidazoline decarboxylase n=1 Tax=Streptomyces sp. 8N706 TaxID=3457416 RepID=UPI003FD1A376